MMHVTLGLVLNVVGIAMLVIALIYQRTQPDDTDTRQRTTAMLYVALAPCGGGVVSGLAGV